MPIIQRVYFFSRYFSALTLKRPLFEMLVKLYHYISVTSDDFLLVNVRLGCLRLCHFGNYSSSTYLQALPVSGKNVGNIFSLCKRPKFDQKQFSDMIGWDVFGWLISCGEPSSDMQRIDSRAVHSLKCFDDLIWNHYQPRRVNFFIKCIARDGISKQGNGKSLVPSIHF